MAQPKSLAELRKSRGTSLAALQQTVETMNKKGGGKEKEADPDEWQCKVDDAGNGSAIFRLLPACKTEDVPFVRLFNHGFKGPTGKWYIENSLTTIGQEDPVQKLNNTLWDSKDKDKIAIARAQKRKAAYWANVLVIKDPANPENEGKVKKFRFNKTIFDMIQAKMKPEEVDPELAEEMEVADPFNPFDFWEGANFSLKIKRKDGYANFDDSKFLKQKPVADNDEDIEAIWDKCHPLQPIVAPDQFKTYEELEKRLHFVLGIAGDGKSSKSSGKTADKEELDGDDEAFIKAAAASSKSKVDKKPAPKKDEDDEPTSPFKEAAKIDKDDLPDAGVDEDDDLAYFRQLAGD